MRTWKIYSPLQELEKNIFSFSKPELEANFELVDEKTADYFLFPVFYETLYEYSQSEYEHRSISPSQLKFYQETFKELERKAEVYQKKIILFYYRDPVAPLPVKSAIVFRTSLNKSQDSKDVFALPAFVFDSKSYLNVIGTEEYFNKPELPTVGFCGLATPLKLPLSTSLRLKANFLFSASGISYRVPVHYNQGYLRRRDAVLSCLKSPFVKTDFIVNNTDPANYKERFYKNMYQNAYTICVSGHGNYSYRFYETLCAGRIPVFIDTDSVLPYEHIVDWKKHVVWVEEKDVANTAQKIADFHSALSSEDFLNLQKENRRIWEEYVSREGFLKHISTCLGRV